MHVSHRHLILTSRKYAITSIRIFRLTKPDHIHLHHPVLEPVPVSSLLRSPAASCVVTYLCLGTLASL